MLLEPIHQLLKHGDHVPYGRYKDLISDPCTSFWDIEGSFLNKKRRTQRKTWIFYGIYSENLLSGMAIVDAGMIATAFAYFYIPSENLYLEDKFTLPLGFGKHFDPSLKDEWKLGKYSIRSSDETMTLTYFGKFKLEITGNNWNFQRKIGISWFFQFLLRFSNYLYKKQWFRLGFSNFS